MDWETLARISNLQTKVAYSIMSFTEDSYFCGRCACEYGGPYPGCLCECCFLAMVDEAFRGELESYPGYVKLPLPRKLLILYLRQIRIANSTDGPLTAPPEKEDRIGYDEW